MKRTGPILTLAAGLALAAVLMVLNLSVTKSDDTADSAAVNTDATAPAATATSAPAPTPTQPPVAGPPVTYAGKVTGGAATIAVAVNDGKAVAYLCDGRSTEAWLAGTATNGELSLTGANNASLTGAYGNGIASGTLNAAGKQWAFSVSKVEPPSGLYRATANVRNAQFVGGWIVFDDGTQTGLGVLAGVVQAVPTLNTTTRSVTVDGTAVSVDVVDGKKL